jgi:hypothetical protein
VRADVEFAARIEIEDSASGVLDLDGCVDADLAFGIQVHVQDAGRLVALHVYEGDALLEAGLRHALLREHLAAQQQDDHAVFVPGADLIGIDEDRLGVAGDVPAEAKQISLSEDRRGRPGRGQTGLRSRRHAGARVGNGPGGRGWLERHSGLLPVQQRGPAREDGHGQERTSQPSV